jgi:hypothetical protein
VLSTVILAVLVAAGGAAAHVGRQGGDITGESADQIVAAAQAAADGAGSVHIKADSTSLRFELWLRAGSGGRGTISQNGLSFKLVRIGPTAYFNGSDRFWAKYGGKAAAQLFHNRWIKASAVKGDLASLSQITNLRALVDSTLAGHGTLAKGSETTIQGQPAIAIEDTTKGGTLYVAATGTPYPLEIKKTGSDGGTIVFDRWNKPVTLTAPHGAIDYNGLTAKTK